MHAQISLVDGLQQIINFPCQKKNGKATEIRDVNVSLFRGEMRKLNC